MKHQIGSFYTQRGFKLFEQSWRVQTSTCSVIIIHGYSEHSGRYAHVANFLAEQQCDVFAFDQYGYGRSEGERAFPDSFDHHAEDIAHFAKRVRQKTDKGKPVYLISHSMGALLSLYALETLFVPIDGIIAIGTATRAGVNMSRPVQAMFKVMAKVMPRYKLDGSSGGELSRDPAVAVRFAADPYTYKDGIPLRTGAEFGRVGPIVEERIGRVTMPILLMHGTADNIADHRASNYLYKHVESENKTLQLYDDCFHELLNEPEQDEVMGDIATWLNQCIAQHHADRASHHQNRKKSSTIVLDENIGKVG